MLVVDGRGRAGGNRLPQDAAPTCSALVVLACREMRVELYDFVGTGLIIKGKTGVVWANQAGGNACLQPECEGLFVPFGNDCALDWKLISLETSLRALFEGLVGGLTLADGLLNDVQAAITRYGEQHWRPFLNVEVDSTLIADSVEAWVHVKYMPASDLPPLFTGLGQAPFDAVLTWPNSD